MNNVSPMKKRNDNSFVNFVAGVVVIALAAPIIAIALGLAVRVFKAVAGL